MARLIKRLAWTLPVLVLILAMDFAVLHLPDTISAFDLNAGTRLEAAEIKSQHEAFRERFRLDEPLIPRFFDWMGSALRFDFGDSMREPRSVREIIGAALPATLWIQTTTLLLMFALGIPLGVFMASRRDANWDRGLRASCYGMQSIPDFWIATILLVFFATRAGWAIFPLEGISDPDAATFGWLSWFADRLHHLVLPVLALALPGLAFIARITRNSLVEELSRDWVTTARAQGISERAILWRFGLKNAMVPVATVFGGVLPGLIGGSVVVERIFNIQGIGQLAFQSTLDRDFPVLQALLLLTAVLTLIGYALSDVLVAALDPRTQR
ncbi:MAG: ABC transporter permease [Planctomycetota bacterium]